MPKKKPIKVKFVKTPFGVSYIIKGGSRESKKIAEDICFALLLQHMFEIKEEYQIKAAEETVNSALRCRGYSTEV